MCIFKVSYIGRGENTTLNFGEIYGVEKTIKKGNGKTVFKLEGIKGEYDNSLFHKLERKGFHYLVNSKVPEVGQFMLLVGKKSDVSEFMTGEVKQVEKTINPGVYTVYTAKAIYEVSAIN